MSAEPTPAAALEAVKAAIACLEWCESGVTPALHSDPWPERSALEAALPVLTEAVEAAEHDHRHISKIAAALHWNTDEAQGYTVSRWAERVRSERDEARAALSEMGDYVLYFIEREESKPQTTTDFDSLRDALEEPK